MATAVKESSQKREATVNHRITVADYSERWLAQVAATRKPRTIHIYRTTLRLHVAPAVGMTPVRNLTRPRLRDLLVTLLNAGKARGTVSVVLAVMRSMLEAAVEDGLIPANPCSKLGQAFRLGVSTEPERVKALDQDQVSAVLGAVHMAEQSHDRRFYPLLFTIARTGLRIGEAIGLKWEDLDFGSRRLLVRRAVSGGKVGTPKSGRERTVSMSPQLVETLGQHRRDLTRETLRRGWKNPPEWVFVTTVGTPMDERQARKVLKRALKRAELPGYFSPHSLRHSFASILMARGESPQYVQEQMGHQSLEMTTRIYGRWLPKQPLRGGVDGLDAAGSKAIGSKMVAAGARGGGSAAQALAMTGSLDSDATRLRSRVGGVNPPILCRCSTPSSTAGSAPATPSPPRCRPAPGP
jgi:integrase